MLDDIFLRSRSDFIDFQSVCKGFKHLLDTRYPDGTAELDAFLKSIPEVTPYLLGNFVFCYRAC